jgi:damage-control phosphatase, subfamily III
VDVSEPKPFTSPIEDDGEPLSDVYNRELKALESDKRHTWFTAPWLYAEYVFPVPELSTSRLSPI